MHTCAGYSAMAALTNISVHTRFKPLCYEKPARSSYWWGFQASDHKYSMMHEPLFSVRDRELWRAERMSYQLMYHIRSVDLHAQIALNCGALFQPYVPSMHCRVRSHPLFTPEITLNITPRSFSSLPVHFQSVPPRLSWQWRLHGDNESR